jgi:hypothetical protein
MKKLTSATLIALVLLLLSLISLIMFPTWNIVIVDSAKGDSLGRGHLGSPSLVLDQNGNPHISYLDFPYESIISLKYAYWTGLTWNTHKVDSIGFTDVSSALAIDSLGNPHIIYCSTFLLKYASWNGTNWNIQTVSFEDITDPSIALDFSGKPSICYNVVYYDNGSAVNNLKYASWNGTGWSTQIVDSTGTLGGGGHNSLTLDSKGNPHISYNYVYSDNNSRGYSDLRYARWNGSTWNIQTVTKNGDYSSLVLDSTGNPHISYQSDNSNSKLMYAYWNNTTWNIQYVDQGGNIKKSLALDSADNPHICYTYDTGDFSSSTQYSLKYASWSGSKWNIQTVIPKEESSSFALDSADKPFISYDGVKLAYYGTSIILEYISVILVVIFVVLAVLLLPKKRPKKTNSVYDKNSETVFPK